MPLAPPSVELSAGTVVERYVIDRVLGSGAQGTVYLVRHTHLGTHHALKVVDNAKPSVAQRLLREGRAQGTLKHSGVVPVTDMVAMRDKLGLVMEYVEGPSLEQLLAGQRLTLSQVDALVPQILSAVAAAHEAGVIHRDLKPGNILLQIQGDQLRTRITDFGLAKLLEPEGGTPRATRSGTPMGTPHYMAPEQVRDASTVDCRADLFSVGAILYEMVTGALAFPGDDIFGVFQRIVVLDYQPPEALCPDLPARMKRSIDACLTLVDDRVASSAELAELWWGGESSPAAAPWSDAELKSWTSLPSIVPSAEPLRPAAPEISESPGQSTIIHVGPTYTNLIVMVLMVLVVGWWVWPRADGNLVSDDPEVQRLFELAYAEMLDADIRTSFDLFAKVVEAEPEAPWPRFLQATASGNDAALAEIAALVDGDSTNEQLIRLVAATRAGEEVDERWSEFFERYPDHFLGRVRVAGLKVGVDPNDYDATVGLYRRAVEAAPEHALGHWLLARHMISHNRLADAREVIDVALVDHPGAPGLLLQKSRQAWAVGDIEGSRQAALSLMHHLPGSTDGRALLAQAHLTLGDLPAYERQVSVLLSEETPAGLASVAARGQATLTFGFGMQRRARELTNACVEIAERARLYDQKVECRVSALQLDRFAQDWDEMEADIGRLKVALAEPEVTAEIEEFGQFRALHATAHAAAARGDLELADSLRARLEDVPLADPVRNRATLILWLDAAIAEARGAVHQPYVDLLREKGDDIGRPYYIGAHFLRAGDERARSELEQVVEASRDRLGTAFTLHHEAEARVLLAEFLADVEPDAALGHVTALRELWPLADEDHDFLRRAAVVEALVSGAD